MISTLKFGYFILNVSKLYVWPNNWQDFGIIINWLDNVPTYARVKTPAFVKTHAVVAVLTLLRRVVVHRSILTLVLAPSQWARLVIKLGTAFVVSFAIFRLCQSGSKCAFERNDTIVAKKRNYATTIAKRYDATIIATRIYIRFGYPHDHGQDQQTASRV